MRTSHIITSALLCASFSSAWTFADSALGELIGEMQGQYKRDPEPQAITLGKTNAASPNPTFSATTSSTSSDSTSTTATGKESGKSSGSTSATGSKSGSSSTSTQASTTVIDPRLPPGGVSMITPNPLSTTQYYKIGDYVTFAWNYTSLSVTPTAIDILATCTANEASYTLALNQTIGNSTGSYLWDTKAFQASATVQLMTQHYTLIIHDAAKPVSAVPSAGYLATFNSFTFGMYLPQSPVALDDFQCVTCSGAMTAMERQSLVVVGLMATFAVLGGTWFTGGLGALL